MGPGSSPGRQRVRGGLHPRRATQNEAARARADVQIARGNNGSRSVGPVEGVGGLPGEDDLVVLAGCQTALGRSIRGEGLLGLSRGFLYAGASRVLASLWKVDDEATAELMKRFYRHMLQKNLPAAAALRAAQIEMWQQKQWRSPYYWAGFVLQGEWK